MKKLLFIFILIVVISGIYLCASQKKDAFREIGQVKKIGYKITTINIDQILMNPRKYQGKHVSVHGRVTNSISVGLRVFAIDDGTGEIFIKTKDAVPIKGEIVKVKGYVNQFFKLFDKHIILIEEESS